MFDADRLYRVTDPEIHVIATRGVLAKWRMDGRGPRYIRLAGRVLYRGSDLNEWLEAHEVETTFSRARRRAAEAAPAAA